MEALLLILDTLALGLLVVTSLRNDRRAPGEPQIGLFRYREPDEAAPLPGRRSR